MQQQRGVVPRPQASVWPRRWFQIARVGAFGFALLLGRLYPGQAAKAKVSVTCWKTTRGISTMSRRSGDIEKRADGHNC